VQGKTIGIIIVAFVVIVGGYFLLRGSYQAPTVTPGTTGGTTKTSPTTQAPASGATEINVVGTEFSFNPASISVKAGEKVKITFRNNGQAPHNLVVEGLGIGTKTIGRGQTDTIEFTAAKAGTYTFFCSVPGHRAAGMEGNLKVE